MLCLGPRHPPPQAGAPCSAIARDIQKSVISRYTEESSNAGDDEETDDHDGDDDEDDEDDDQYDGEDEDVRM